jgi:hypothetical protein
MIPHAPTRIGIVLVEILPAPITRHALSPQLAQFRFGFHTLAHQFADSI